MEKIVNKNNHSTIEELIEKVKKVLIKHKIINNV